jgi:hypothetical protein
MEWSSEMDNPPIGKGAPLEAFTNSLVVTLKLQSNKDQRFKITSDSQDLVELITVGIFQEIVFTIGQGKL